MQKLLINTFEEYQQIYALSISNPEKFWATVAEEFSWQRKWDKVLPESKLGTDWFSGAVLNVTENMLDRNLIQRGNKLALIWEPNDPKQRAVRYTYRELYEQVCQFANALKSKGIQKGDRVCIYMPMIPEQLIAMLACARIGAVHSVIFAGFSANAIADRVNDAQAKMVITADGLNRGAKQIPLKRVVDEALEKTNCVETVLVFDCLGWLPSMQENRDFWWHDVLVGEPKSCVAEPMQAADPLFMLYTSGSVGKPKGVVHACAGFMVYSAYTFLNVYQNNESDIHWCSADIGWITGHSYMVYGPLLTGATTLMYEGIPTYPDAGRYWQIIDKHGVNSFLTSPTAIRALMAAGDDHVLSYSLDSLKVLGTVGEPISNETWKWFYLHVGKERCPVVDSWWQTETGGVMISGLGDISPVKATYAGYPLPGIQPVLIDENGDEINQPDVEGFLCITASWPGMLQGLYQDDQRFQETYFSPIKAMYFTGDSAKKDDQGMFKIIGRVDDVINVSGHRLGASEIENAINLNAFVLESAVVSFPHPLKGNSLYAFVVLDDSAVDKELIQGEIIETVLAEIGKIALPEKIQFVSGLPKTRSGKVMRRILRKIAEGDMTDLGDISTLLDPFVVDDILENVK